MRFLKTSYPLQKPVLSVKLQHFKQDRNTMYIITPDYLCEQFCKQKMFLTEIGQRFCFDIQTLLYFFNLIFFTTVFAQMP